METYRQLVEARAGGACEYCRLLQAATGVTFHIDHFVPTSLAGLTVINNLVLSCPGCNLSKAGRIRGRDDSGKEHPLFNPRHYEPCLLGWHLHFTLDRDSGIVVARTSTGQATVNVLKLNDALRVFARKLQVSVGLIA